MKTLKENDPILQVKGLKKYFPVSEGLFGLQKKYVKAVNDISFTLYEGETYGLVGESGCGKSTTGRTILQLTDPTEGELNYQGKNLFALSNLERQKFRKDIQMVFQDPYSSLNPRKRIGKTLEETLEIHSLGTKDTRSDLILSVLEKVGMRIDHYYRYPHELSGGQRQRIGLARALIVNPKIIIADEPVSALDVSIQSQVLNLLRKLQQEMNLTYLFIAHDISVVRHISDRIGVMYLGSLVEEAETNILIKSPKHPYTQALISAVPIPNPQEKKERIILKGDLPSPMDLPKGCVFHTRCPLATEICKQEKPVLKEIDKNHSVACHLY